MRSEIKWALYCIGLGMSLVAYAHLTFATKGRVKTMQEMLSTMDQRLYDLHQHHGLKDKKK